VSLADFLVTPLGGTPSRDEGQTTWSLLDGWLTRELDDAQRLPPIMVMLTVGLLCMVNPRCLLDPEVWVGVAVFGGLPAAIIWGLKKLRRSFKEAPFVCLMVLVFAAMMAATWPTEIFYGASGVGLLLALRSIMGDLLCLGSSVFAGAGHLLGDLISAAKPGPSVVRPKVVTCAPSEHRSGAQRGLIRYVEGGADGDDDADGSHACLVLTLRRDGPLPAGARVGWRERFFMKLDAAEAAVEVSP